jgi:hypothetical protein
LKKIQSDNYEGLDLKKASKRLESVRELLNQALNKRILQELKVKLRLKEANKVRDHIEFEIDLTNTQEVRDKQLNKQIYLKLI